VVSGPGGDVQSQRAVERGGDSSEKVLELTAMAAEKSASISRHQRLRAAATHPPRRTPVPMGHHTGAETARRQ